MTTPELDSSCFESTVSRHGVLVVQCWASWCGGCEAFEPTFDAVSRRHSEVRFARLDTGSHPELTETVGVTQVPTLLVFRDGVLLLRHPGGADESVLEDIVAQSLALDMDVVQAEMEREARETDGAVT